MALECLPDRLNASLSGLGPDLAVVRDDIKRAVDIATRFEAMIAAGQAALAAPRDPMTITIAEVFDGIGVDPEAVRGKSFGVTIMLKKNGDLAATPFDQRVLVFKDQRDKPTTKGG